jgi:ABC-type multidrug transport system ATPase subunit
MPHPKGRHPGTTWRKTDLQCHTPRDLNWAGGPSLPGNSGEEISAREAWAAEFIAACVTKGLSAVAITDHHDIVLAAYVQRAGEESNPPVSIYPGVEITCADAAQCLVIFDPSTDTATLQKLLGKLPGVVAAADGEAKTCSIVPTNWTVAQLVDAIAEDSALQGSCIVFPNFGDPSSHKSLNKPGHNTRFADLKSDGVYTDAAYDTLDPTTLEKAYGKVAEWGTRRRGIIVTGDNRNANWERLGANGCWIKLGENTLEAVRQALLADEARIAYQAPTEPLERVVELTVKSTLTGDAQVTISFNPGFNAFIGGRGSGKSAVLEYLRYGLARTERDLGHDSSREREEQLIEETLVGGFVEVVIQREGVTETWHRDLGREQIIVSPATGTGQLALSLADARRRFRGRAFFQKQLSSTTRNADSAIEQITGIAAAEALDKRREIDQAIDNAKREVKTKLQLVVAHWQTAYEKASALTRVEDLKLRISGIGDLLKSEGVSEEHLQIISDAPRYARGRAYINQVIAQIENERERLNDTRRNILLLPMEQFADISTFPELADLNSAVNVARDGVTVQIDQAFAALDNLEAMIGAASASFNIKESEFSTQYAEAVALQTKQKSLLDENARLNTELQAAEARVSDLTTKLTESAEVEGDFAEAREVLKGLIASRRDVLAEAAEQVADKSSSLLKARLKKDPAPAEYSAALDALMHRATVPDSLARCETWVRSELADDPDHAWDFICDGIIDIYKTKIALGRPNEPDETLAEMLNQFLGIEGNVTARQVSRIYANVEDGIVGDIISAVPNDYIAMTYIDAGKDMAFAKASPGQQASALLELLLKQSAGTLIIDQPEDDLDNRVIMRIVELIRKSKGHRQLIFATHNPNIVVNGDADKIVALKAGDPVVGNQPENPRVEISEDGAIETPAMRDVITQIMEGGQEAFDLRSRKYRFEA